MNQDAHAFRGEFVDVFTHIERWAMDVIRSEAAIQNGLIKAKPPHLLGQKIELIRTLANGSAPVFAHPARVRTLLEHLAPYLKLRSEVVHSTLRIVNDDEGEIWAFDNPAASSSSAATGRLWLKANEAKVVLSELRKCRKLLADQRTKPTKA